jgi:two-component system response regulator YesN
MEELTNRTAGFKVLIVEDSVVFRQVFKDTLEFRFPLIEIEEAGDGKEALQKIETFNPDLIFMDIRLPGENGLELTQKIKARHPNIIVTILTGYDFPEYKEVSDRVADYFFLKGSSTPDSIFALVKSILLTDQKSNRRI